MEIRVRFVTEYTKYRVTETPISVPARLGRYGLSELINHLLSLGKCPGCCCSCCCYCSGAALGLLRLLRAVLCVLMSCPPTPPLGACLELTCHVLVCPAARPSARYPIMRTATALSNNRHADPV